MILKTISFEEIVKPKGVILEQINDATIVGISDNKPCRYLSDSATYYNDTYSEVEINLLKGS